MNLLNGTQHCSMAACEDPARATLNGKAFCLEHFIVHCYELLEQLDPRIRGKRDEGSELSSLRDAVEDCSNRALLVSLRFEALTNLDRSRLLDILLWSSELLFLLNISPRDFDILKAFRKDSETGTDLDTTAVRLSTFSIQRKREQNC
jgi:hypothetical protein